MGISTHILDTASGRPASGVGVELERDENGEWLTLNAAHTDADGRIRHLLPEDQPLVPGTYCIRFATAQWYASQKLQGLYPIIEITFNVEAGQAHYHIPLLLTANGYTTYRGS